MLLSFLTWLNTVMKKKKKFCSSLSFSVPVALESVHRDFFFFLNFCKKMDDAWLIFGGRGAGGWREIEGGIDPEIFVLL